MKKILPIISIYTIILIAIPFIVSADVIIKNPLKYDTIEKVIEGITGLIVAVAIGVGVIMLIIAGIQYMTSVGNEQQATKAKNTIKWTIIGVAIAISVDFIVGLIQEILGKE